MEVYILDDLLRRVQVVDKFESLIWTERFSAYGDFSMSLHSTLENRKRFSPGTKLVLNESHRVMTVETIENTVDADGKATLNLKGRSLEAILLDRVAKQTINNLTVSPTWDITDTPMNIARHIFQKMCREGILSSLDVIPFLMPGSMFPASTIIEPPTEITVKIAPTTVYDAIKELADLYGFGFRLTRNFDTSELYFDVYTGNDLTTQQTTSRAVVFSPELDNLQNTTELTSIDQYKNIAYVYSPVGFQVVYGDDADVGTAGFDRRVLVVTADDITTTVPEDAASQMQQRGREELSKYKQFSAFDGEISKTSGYKYGVDYNLGDIVETRLSDGNTNNMRVTEQILVSDSEGDRIYPTLTVEKFIMAGTWLAWDYNQVWEDVPPTEFWSNQ